MPYLSPKTIAKAWESCIESGVSNAFMGLLQVMRLIDDYSIEPSKQYEIDADELSYNLENLFTFDDNPTRLKTIQQSRRRFYFVVFPQYWMRDVDEYFLKGELPIRDVAIICLQNYHFLKVPTDEELFLIFEKEYKIEISTNWSWSPWNMIFSEYIIEFVDELTTRKALANEIVNHLTLPKMGYKTLGFERTTKNHIYISANAGELSRAPFFQTLYSSQRSINCLMITKFDFFEKYDLAKRKRYIQDLPKTPIQNFPHQKIYFGSPGTGKSYKINNEVARGYEKFVVTFHPDFDYFDFVGSYKPMTIEENEQSKIIYRFVPQRFIEAYVKTWQTGEPIFLVIEEINRGRCASVFGDIFQLLDRDENGYSEYSISASKELSNYLAEALSDNEAYIQQIEKLYFDKNQRDLDNPFSILLLPNNLYLYATMNTSDQALFPMDSAFKRRWEWEYMPINYEKASDFIIDLEELGQVDWNVFLENINQKIYDITQSEDKQIGTWFVKTSIIKDEKRIISKTQFLNKVLYYLWFDVFMYESKSQDGYIFKASFEDGTTEDFTYSKLFGLETDRILKGFFDFNNIPLNA